MLEAISNVFVRVDIFLRRETPSADAPLATSATTKFAGPAPAIRSNPRHQTLCVPPARKARRQSRVALAGSLIADAPKASWLTMAWTPLFADVVHCQLGL